MILATIHKYSLPGCDAVYRCSVTYCLVPNRTLHYITACPLPVSVYFDQRTTHT